MRATDFEMRGSFFRTDKKNPARIISDARQDERKNPKREHKTDPRAICTHGMRDNY